MMMMMIREEQENEIARLPKMVGWQWWAVSSGLQWWALGHHDGVVQVGSCRPSDHRRSVALALWGLLCYGRYSGRLLASMLHVLVVLGQAQGYGVLLILPCLDTHRTTRSQLGC
jgi:hypothetical protein